LDTPSYSALS